MYTLHNMKIRYRQEIALMKPKKTLYAIVLRLIQVKDPTCLKSQSKPYKFDFSPISFQHGYTIETGLETFIKWLWHSWRQHLHKWHQKKLSVGIKNLQWWRSQRIFTLWITSELMTLKKFSKHVLVLLTALQLLKVH